MQPKFANRKQANIGQGERNISMVGGGALLLYALSRPSRSRLPFILSSGYLLYRGITGRDYIYQVMGINRAGLDGSRGVEVERTMTVFRPRPEVYAFWHDFELLPQYMQHLESVKVIEPARSHWTAHGPLGMKVEWYAETTEDRPNELIAWRSLPGSDIENRGLVRFKDAPGNRGTEIHVQLSYLPPAGSASAIIAKLFGEEPSRQVLDDLRRFKQVIETGEVATVTGQTSGRSEQVIEERQQITRRKTKDVVQEASEESFPASDPPAWTGGETGGTR